MSFACFACSIRIFVSADSYSRVLFLFASAPLLVLSAAAFSYPSILILALVSIDCICESILSTSWSAFWSVSSSNRCRLADSSEGESAEEMVLESDQLDIISLY
jgi:hypothetical protein